MPAEKTFTETVTLDRELVIDLLTETYAVCDILEDLAGVTPLALTEELGFKLERVSVAILGPHGVGPGGEIVGPAADLWGEHAPRRAKQLARELIRAR